MLVRIALKLAREYVRQNFEIIGALRAVTSQRFDFGVKLLGSVHGEVVKRGFSSERLKVWMFILVVVLFTLKFCSRGKLVRFGGITHRSEPYHAHEAESVSHFTQERSKLIQETETIVRNPEFPHFMEKMNASNDGIFFEFLLRMRLFLFLKQRLHVVFVQKLRKYLEPLGEVPIDGVYDRVGDPSAVRSDGL